MQRRAVLSRSSHCRPCIDKSARSQGCPRLSAALPQVVALLPRQEVQPLALGLLYHLSLEDKHRSMFLYTGGYWRRGLAAAQVAVVPCCRRRLLSACLP